MKHVNNTTFLGNKLSIDLIQSYHNFFCTVKQFQTDAKYNITRSQVHFLLLVYAYHSTTIFRTRLLLTITDRPRIFYNLTTLISLGYILRLSPRTYQLSPSGLSLIHELEDRFSRRQAAPFAWKWDKVF